MFGLKKLAQEVLDLRASIDESSKIVGNNTKELHHYADRGATVLKVCNDTKVDISLLKNKFADIEFRMIHLENNVSNSNKQTAEILSQYEKHNEDRDALLKEIVQKHEVIFRYMQELEKVTANVELIMESYLPVKSVPKLPKTRKATTDRL